MEREFIESGNILSWKCPQGSLIQLLALHTPPNNPSPSIPGSSVQTLLQQPRGWDLFKDMEEKGKFRDVFPPVFL